MTDDDALKILQGVYDKGCRHFDTAEVYGVGNKCNESILGAFFQTVPRDSFTVATKYWPLEGDPTMYTYERIKTSLTASLSRLGLAHVDLYYAHRVLTLEGGLEFGRAAHRLKKEGLIKEIGLSEVRGRWLKEIHAKVGPIDAVQREWSLLSRTLEGELVPVCKQLDIPIVSYSPLAENLFPENWDRPLSATGDDIGHGDTKIVDTIEQLSIKYRCTAAQLTLAWLFYKASELGVAVVPIPSATTLAHVESHVGSVKIKIDKDDARVLERVVDQIRTTRD